MSNVFKEMDEMEAHLRVLLKDCQDELNVSNAMYATLLQTLEDNKRHDHEACKAMERKAEEYKRERDGYREALEAISTDCFDGFTLGYHKELFAIAEKALRED